MINKLYFVLICGVITFYVSSVLADQWPTPTSDYSADYTIKSEKMEITLKLTYSPGKIRTELPGGGGVIIYRADKKSYWTISPSNSYVERPSSEYEATEILMGDVKSIPLAEEIIENLKTTKFKVSVTTKKGTQGEGFVWSTKDNIVVKTSITLNENGQKTRQESYLKNLSLGKVDAKLFELPKILKKIGDFSDFKEKSGTNKKTEKHPSSAAANK